jgi:hypothetical protein
LPRDASWAATRSARPRTHGFESIGDFNLGSFDIGALDRVQAAPSAS